MLSHYFANFSHKKDILKFPFNQVDHQTWFDATLVERFKECD